LAILFFHEKARDEAAAKAAFIDEVVSRVERKDGKLTGDERKELRRHCETWFDTATQSLEYNYGLSWSDFRPGILAKFLLDHVLDGEKPNYVVDWVLMPAVKDYAGLWLTEDARRRWDGTVVDHPVSRGS
jgi:hypothetical protein